VSDPRDLNQIVPGRPVRHPSKWPGQENFHGYYWFAGTHAHVWHESLTEYAALMLIDHERDVVSVVAQPFSISFGIGVPHVPDYFMVEMTEHRVLVDVHPEDLTTETDAVKFALTRGMCAALGWEYILIGQLSKVTIWNLEMMARYRHPMFQPSTEVADLVLRLLGQRSRFGDLLRALQEDPARDLLPALYHLMWARRITFDLAAPFTFGTLLESA
jgi:hypothetical protein